MDRYEEYRAQAEHCRRMAERAITEADKAEWLQLAQSWMSMVPTAPAQSHRHRGPVTMQQQQPQPGKKDE